MAAYPSTLPVSIGSTVRLEADRQTDRASNGAARGRVFYTAAKRKFKVEHQALKPDEQTTLLDFYAANTALSFTFDWPLDGVTYTVIFSGEPDFKPLGAQIATVSVELQEV